jgi:hypothetical protein
MRKGELSSDDLREVREDNGTVPTEGATPRSEHPANEKPPTPFKPKRIDLTPDEPVNIGYVGGVRRPKKQNQ